MLSSFGVVRFFRYCLFCAIVVCRSVDTELVVVEVRFVLFGFALSEVVEY